MNVLYCRQLQVDKRLSDFHLTKITQQWEGTLSLKR